MSDLKAYLAEKYMSGPKADAILAKTGPLKKKRKKEKDSMNAGPSSAGGARIVDEDDSGWPQENKEEDDDLAEAVVASDRGFKKRKTKEGESNWVTLQEGLGGVAPKIEEEDITPPDEQPMVVDTTPFVGGLVSAKKLKSVLPQNAVAKETDYTAEEIARAQETVYRDASGKKIDTKAVKAEAARLKREREEQEAKKMEWGKGLVQREERDKRREELEKNRGKAFSTRYADDADLNEDLKAQDRWNDPAAAFLTKKKSKGPRRPEYTGPPPPPNRFGIKPGYRWDGVDRGNGFEKRLFQAQNSRKRRGAESYAWGVDDM